jgi:septal ring factor EnvC (AmiA/AmiB activator)
LDAVSRLLRPVTSGLPWAVALVAAVIAYQSLLGQVALQVDLAHAMQGVATSVRSVRSMTEETAGALAPLAQVTGQLRGINGELKTIVQDLGAINQSLVGINHGQAALTGTLTNLNQQLAAVSDGLAVVDRTNRALRERTESLAGQTGEQAGHVEALAGLTRRSVDALRTLNDRLGFLRQF